MPNKTYGQAVKLGVKKEAVRGTAEATADFWIPTTDRDIDEKQEFIQDESSYGILEGPAGQSVSKQWCEGQITAPITDKLFGVILLNLFGSVNSVANADTSATVKDHTFSVLQSAQHPSLTLFIDDPASGQDYKYALGMLESMDINYEQGKFVEYVAKFRAKKGAVAAQTPATVVENRFTANHVTFKVAANLAGLAAGNAMNIKSFKLSIKKALEDDYVLGSKEPVDYLVKSFNVDGTFDAFWASEADYKTTFMANTPQAFRIDLLNGDTVIGTSAHPQLTIDMALVYFTELTRAFKNGNVITQTLGFKAMYSLTDSKMLTAKLTNTQASY